MNKSDLVSKLTARLDGNRSTATAAVNGILEEIEQSLARGEKVSLVGFGTFDRRERGPRTVRNPATGASMQVGASVAPVFRAGAGLKQLLSEAAGTAGGSVRAAAATTTSAVQAVQAVPAAAANALAPAAETARKAAKKSASKAPKGPKAASKKASKTTAAAAKGAGKKPGKTAKKG